MPKKTCYYNRKKLYVETPTLRRYKELSGEISDVIDKVSNELEPFVSDIKEHRAHNKNRMKQLQRLFPTKLEEFEEHINQRAHKRRRCKYKFY